MFELYDELIEGIPEGIRVSEYMVGCTAAFVCADGAMGISETVFNNRMPSNMKDEADITLKEMAALLKSWNYTQASLGLAAVNCWYNRPEKLEAAGMSLKEVRRNPFGRMKSAVENKKAALIGHMGYLEEAISQSCQMSVITDKPRDMGDYSAAAAEFILGEQDYVFADGKSIVSKKLTRLLELSDRVFLVGIGVPLGDALFSRKVFEQQGFCVADQPFCKRLISRGAPISELFQALLFTTNRRDKSCS